MKWFIKEETTFISGEKVNFCQNSTPFIQFKEPSPRIVYDKTDHFGFQDIEKLAVQSNSVKIDELSSTQRPIHHQNTQVSW